MSSTDPGKLPLLYAPLTLPTEDLWKYCLDVVTAWVGNEAFRTHRTILEVLLTIGATVPRLGPVILNYRPYQAINLPSHLIHKVIRHLRGKCELFPSPDIPGWIGLPHCAQELRQHRLDDLADDDLLGHVTLRLLWLAREFCVALQTNTGVRVVDAWVRGIDILVVMVEHRRLPAYEPSSVKESLLRWLLEKQVGRELAHCRVAVVVVTPVMTGGDGRAFYRADGMFAYRSLTTSKVFFSLDMTESLAVAWTLLYQRWKTAFEPLLEREGSPPGFRY